MAMDKFKSSYSTVAGETKEVEVGLQDVKEAGRLNMNLSAYLAEKYPDADPNKGSAFGQIAASVGFNLNPKALHKPTMADVLEGRASAAGIVAPDGEDRSIAGRLFMPEIILAMQEKNLFRNTSRLRESLMSKVAINSTVNGKTYYRPVVDSDTNKNLRYDEIGQGATPNVLVKISASERPYVIPTKSFGLEITDEALASSTLDQVGMMIGSARRSIDNNNVYNWISRMVNGDAQFGITALTPIAISSYDSGATLGAVTQKAWVKALLANQEYWEADTMIATEDSYIAVENRATRPTVSDDTGRDNRLNAGLNLMNVSLDTIDTIMVADEAALGGAGNFLLFDSMQSLEYAVNASAAYEAMENYVMRRTNQMRFDTAEEMFRFRDDAMALISRS